MPFTEVLFYQIALLRDKEISNINGSITAKSKGCDFWHNIHKVWQRKFTNVISFVYVSGKEAGLNLARYLSDTSQ